VTASPTAPTYPPCVAYKAVPFSPGKRA
jgi:hypothetical protein